MTKHRTFSVTQSLLHLLCCHGLLINLQAVAFPKERRRKLEKVVKGRESKVVQLLDFAKHAIVGKSGFNGELVRRSVHKGSRRW